jgi:hypothetical protein
LLNSALRDLAARSKPFHGFNSSASSETSVPASKDSFGRIHYDWKQSRLTFTNNSILFLNNFLAGPEGLAKKTLKFGLNECSVQNEKLTCTYIHKSVLIIDCHWHGFGEIGDRFDLIITLDEIDNSI